MFTKSVKTTKGAHYCFVCTSNSAKNPTLSFFRFPKEEDRYIKWKACVNIADLENYDAHYSYTHFRICSLHFEDSMFSSMQKNRLRKDAVPTIFKDKAFSADVQSSTYSDPHDQPSTSAAIDIMIDTPASTCNLDPYTQPSTDTTENVSRIDVPSSSRSLLFSYSQPSTSTTRDMSTPDASSTFTCYEQQNIHDTEKETGSESIEEAVWSEDDPEPIYDEDETDIKLVDSFTQTSSKLSARTPRKQALKLKVRALKRKMETPKSKPKPVITEEDMTTFIEENYSATMASFMRTQLTLTKTSPRGARYSDEYKQFALTIYFLGPKVYKYLMKTLRLPSKSTLYRITNRWSISVGFSEFLFSAIKIKANLLAENNKDCVLCLDEMSIKTHLFYNLSQDEIVGFHQTNDHKTYDPASNVLVLMARGINSNWKQPLAYFFLSTTCPVEDLKNIIFYAVNKLKDIGLNVLALISDQGSNFYKLSKSLNISEDNPYFFVEGSKIFYMFDVPHLLKSTRNNFFSYLFETPEGITNKEYLNIFYLSDKQEKYRLAAKLTDRHLNPNSFQKMKVKLAAQIFSASVVAALNSYISFTRLPLAATATVSFIEKIDKLFDMLNSSKFSGAKVFNRPFMGSASQITFLKEMYDFFKNITVKDSSGKDVTKKMKFIYGWKLTISAFLGLWEALKGKGIHRVFTRRLNQDCLENFFGSIRQQSGNCRNPTPIQFQRAFKKLFVLNYFQQSEGSNCLEEFDSLLGAITPDIIKTYQQLLPQESIFQTLKINTTDYTQLELPAQNGFVYVAGYFIKKILEKHSCNVCKNYAKGTQELSESTLYSHFRAYPTKSLDTFGNLQMPNKLFYDYLHMLENIFCELFPKMSLEKHIGINIKEKMQNIDFFHPCTDFPLDYLLSLFVRVRIFFTVKFINREFKTQKSNKENYKIAVLKHL